MQVGFYLFSHIMVGILLKMKKSSILTRSCLILVFLLSPVPGQTQSSSNFPQVNQGLFSWARDLWAPAELRFMGYQSAPADWSMDEYRVRLSCLYLQAATELAPDNALLWQDMITLLTSPAIDDPGRATDALVAFSQLERDNAYPIDLWLGYRLERYNEREDRELFLQTAAQGLQNFPSSLSDTLTQLGLFALEKGDLDTAQNLFNNAYSTNLYNDEPLNHLAMLISPKPQPDAEITLPDIQSHRLQKNLFTIIQWRTRLHNNPYDLNALVQLIQNLDELGAYEIAQDYYKAAYDLIALSPEPDQVLIQELRLKQLASSYSAGQYHNCLELCRDLLQSEPNNLTALALSIKSAQQLGTTPPDISNLENVVQDVLKKSQADEASSEAELQKLTWFYCFIVPEPPKALAMARQFDAAAQQSSQSQALLALTHIQNEQHDEAQAILETLDPVEPLAAVAQARLHLLNNQPDLARQVLYDMDYQKIPNGLIAEQIEELLETTVPSPADDETTSDTNTEQNLLSPLEKQQQSLQFLAQNLAMFSGEELAFPYTEEAMVRCLMRPVKHSDIAYYGDPLLVQIYLSNVSTNDLILGPGNLIDPHLLIYVAIEPLTSTSRINKKRQNEKRRTHDMTLLAHRYLGQHRILRPGQSNVVTESLNIEPIRQRLEHHPQRSYRINVQICLDPVPDGQGGFTGKIESILPEPLTLIRKGFNPTRKNMQYHYDTAQKGNTKERLQSIYLLAGLLREAALDQAGEINYAIKPVDTNHITNLLKQQLTDEDFHIRGWSAYALGLLPKPQGKHLAAPLTDCLNDPHWLVRFMASQSLQALMDMTEYNQWAAEQADHEIIQRQAQLYLDLPWDIKQAPPLPEPQPDNPPN